MIDIPLEIAVQTPVAGDRSEAAHPVERLTDAQKDELREKAEKATPGPWKLSEDADGKPHEILGMFNNAFWDPVVKCTWASATKRGRDDYDFIVAANPQTVLSLLSEMKAMGEELSAVKKDRDKFSGLLDISAMTRDGALLRAEAAESQLSTLTKDRDEWQVASQVEAKARLAAEIAKDLAEATISTLMEKVTGAAIEMFIRKSNAAQTAALGGCETSKPSSLPEAGKEIGNGQ